MAGNANTSSSTTSSAVARKDYADADWFSRERDVVQKFAQASKRLGGIPDLNTKIHGEQMERTKNYLNELEFNTNMSPLLMRKAKIDQGLELFSRADCHFPEDVQRQAENLYQRFTAVNWDTVTAPVVSAAPAAQAVDNDDNSGGDESVSVSASDSDSDSDSDSPPSAATAPAAAQGNTTGTVLLPARNDPHYGPNGIMHGLLQKVGKAKTHIFDPDYPRPSAHVSGHNGVQVGHWCPTQHHAMVCGVHGQREAGISGNERDGAHSVVVAEKYKGVNNDLGNTIYYSIPGSADNKDKHSPPDKRGTKCLNVSLQNGNPVRVLRAANGTAYAPKVGIRYDGLYQVVRREENHWNDKGGRFTLFVLQRLAGQESLASIGARSPTAQEITDYNNWRARG
ncbi:ydg sra domain-containing protein [Diaporthe amygdali]|uniref:ydg sra domain-containing protein n=1 Tax=Phomopsis amygdali TaxID=1214568 RepID=UPI0022FE094D|nr:ydg sra domain-containing protein [Diaporthe amygdali]KAJ0121049.1 ydg sra domain-containing protein [Diaporthe amygdali]